MGADSPHHDSAAGTALAAPRAADYLAAMTEWITAPGLTEYAPAAAFMEARAAAIAKAVEIAKKNFFHVPMIRRTIPHLVQGEDSAGVVLLRPASPGTGVIAGGAARPVLECAGVQDILSKSLGSDNALNVVRATVDGLKQLVRPEEVAARRGKSIEEVTPARMLRKRAGQEA